MKNKKRFVPSLDSKDGIKKEEIRRPGSDKAKKARTDRKREESDFRRSHEELRNLAARLQSVREEERRALSRELHDNLGQALTAMKLNLHWLDHHALRVDDARLRKEIVKRTREFEALLESAITTVHSIASDLRPSILDEMGLWPALESEAARFVSRTGIECVVHPWPTLHEVLDEDLSLAIFRIAQEALTNIARHAKATVVEISCVPSGSDYTLCIIDNGRGISAAEAESPHSLGLIGIRERVRGFGGEFSISRAGITGGTAIRVRIPAGSTGNDT